MKPAQSLLSFAAPFAAVAVLACSSATSPLPTGLSDPPGAVSFTGTLPSVLPTDCFAGDYYPWTSGGPCEGTTYLLCYGRTWDQYSCIDPESPSNAWYEFSVSAGGGQCNVDDECVAGAGCDLTTSTCVPPSPYDCGSDYCCASNDDCGTGGICDLNTYTCE